MSKIGKDLIKGLTEAVAFARAAKGGARVHFVEAQMLIKFNTKCQ
jgi:hypothetical protein